VHANEGLLFSDNTNRPNVQAVTVQAMLFKTLQQLRPDAISLVDAWHFTDYELHSALGRKDGQVYQGLLDMARSSPLNETEVGPAWETVLKPAIKQFQSKL
jgi:acyl-CoA oxidase